MAVKNNDDVNRAAQFLPFDALKGLSEELQSRIEKRMRVPKHEFSDEKKEELSKTLVRVDKGTVVRIKFYLNGHYIDIEGKLSRKLGGTTNTNQDLFSKIRGKINGKKTAKNA